MSNQINMMADAEMQEAIDELEQAQQMLDTATSKWRIDEAIARISAAHFRIQAIKYEKGGINCENLMVKNFMTKQAYCLSKSKEYPTPE